MVCIGFIGLRMSGSYVQGNEFQGFINVWHLLTSWGNTSSAGRILFRGISQSVEGDLHTVHTARGPTPRNHSQHKKCRTPYAVIHSLVLLKIGIMMPETCFDRSLIINTRLVASCWFLSLHPTFMMHGHKSLKFKTDKENYTTVTTTNSAPSTEIRTTTTH